MKPTKLGTLSAPSLLMVTALAMVILSACGGSDAARWSQGPSPCEPSSETLAAEPAQFARQIEGAVPDDIGKLRISFDGDGQQDVIVFEENHASRAGQIELAIILNRLYHRHGVRHLALEGAVLEEKPPNAAWFHELPDETVRRQVAVQLLEKGEVSAAGFAAMVFADFQLHPNEREDEYRVKLPNDASGAFNMYLFAIARESMDSGQQQTASRLYGSSQALKDGGKEEEYNEKLREYFEFIFSSNEWTKGCNDYLDREGWSLEGLIRIIDDAKVKVEEDGIEVGDVADRLKTERRFYVAASDRSGTMVENSIEVASSHSQAPIVLNIGAAHTERVVELLKSRSASLAVIAPVSLETGDPNGSLSAGAYDRKLDRKSVDPSGGLGAILDGRSKKPSSVLNEEWFQFMGNILYAIVKLAAAAGAGGDPPFGLGNDVLNIRGAEIPPDSIHLLEGDVIFAVILPDGQEFFVRAKQIDSESKILDDEVSLEQALLTALENVTTETSINVDEISTEKPALVEAAPGIIARISKELKALEDSGPLSKEEVI